MYTLWGHCSDVRYEHPWYCSVCLHRRLEILQSDMQGSSPTPPLLTIPTSHKKAGALSAYTLFTWITKTHFFTHQDISLWCKEIFPPLPLTPFPPLSFTGWKTKGSVSLVWHHLDSHLSCHHLEHHQYCWASYQICLTTKTKVACYHEILLFQNF